ncbi:MAG: hypothetical protein GKR87_10515 [Kiritimatiellae bacterium]|nr:hypothetical protein [Kiritimatiellia bacterium]
MKIVLEIKNTSGSIENIRLLQDERGVDIAFVQGGVGNEIDIDGSESLPSLFYEPLWIFYRGEETISRLEGLNGKTIAVGPEGSGTRALAHLLLSDNGLLTSGERLSSISGKAAKEALQNRHIDAAFFVTSSESILVKELCMTPGIKLMSLDRVDAYIHKYPFYVENRLA